MLIVTHRLVIYVYRHITVLFLSVIRSKHSLIIHKLLYLQEEEERTVKLLNEATKLQRDLRQTNYLDRLICLLNGETDKIHSMRWPFKVGSDVSNQREFNLIV